MTAIFFENKKVCVCEGVFVPARASVRVSMFVCACIGILEKRKPVRIWLPLALCCWTCLEAHRQLHEGSCEPIDHTCLLKSLKSETQKPMSGQQSSSTSFLGSWLVQVTTCGFDSTKDQNRTFWRNIKGTDYIWWSHNCQWIAYARLSWQSITILNAAIIWAWPLLWCWFINSQSTDETADETALFALPKNHNTQIHVRWICCNISVRSVTTIEWALQKKSSRSTNHDCWCKRPYTHIWSVVTICSFQDSDKKRTATNSMMTAVSILITRKCPMPS